MAIQPPAKCLRATITVSGAIASALGHPSTSIPAAVYLATSPFGHDLIVAFQLNGVWTDMTRPTGAPGVIDGPKFDLTMWPEIRSSIAAIGAKEWIVRNLMTWVTDFLRALFSSLGAVVGQTPPPTTDNSDWRLIVNDTLADQFTLRDENGDGIPEMRPI